MSHTQTLLLELHCEEIPARFLQPLHEEFGQKFVQWATSQGLPLHSLAWAPLYSPRKLAWKFDGIPLQQPDQSETQVGPPQRLCVDEHAQPTQTGLKFAEKWGVDFSAVQFLTPTGKKEPCAQVTLTKVGRPTRELLAEALPGLIASLHVPKAMRWGRSEFTFVRPIRNLLCLFGEEAVTFTVDGVTAGSSTWGHRLHHRNAPDPVIIANPESYEAALAQAGVIASFKERRALLAEQMERLAREVNGHLVADEDLLTVLAEIVEFPTIVRGSFPPEFLKLPKEVLVTSLKEHQKSFCIKDGKGELLPYFLAAANRPITPGGEAEKLVAGGNEWVLKARLYDARFFFAEDLKHPLASRLDKLKALTFQRELGSYLEKTERMALLAGMLAEEIGLDPTHAQRSARLSKADLRTLMVGEFPELQGVMGGEYLKQEDAPPEIWKAVNEHYLPAGAEDALPETPEGALLSIVDKLDTVTGCFAVGIIPSGSKDPLALRRAGLGLVRVLWAQDWDLDLMHLCGMALGIIGAKASQPEAETLAALESFFRDRVAYQIEQAGYAGTVRRSALAIGFSNLPDLRGRCESLSRFAGDERFGSLAQSAKRITNILKDENPSDEFDEGLLTQVEEKELAGRLAALDAVTDRDALLEGLAELARPLEAYFNSVMVKCEDPALRQARLAQLHRLRKAFLRMADFSLWQ
jgi:glycyl-tRNA synthetase beta chain